jgi:hypothetical protein
MAKEIEVPHDPRFAELWGENYRGSEAFQKLVVEPVQAGRLLRFVLADLFENHPRPRSPAW